MVVLEPVIRAIVDISLLVLVAMILSELFIKMRISRALGELFAGIILGPSAIGLLTLTFFGWPLLELNEIVLAFAEIGVILIIFSGTVQMSFRDFRVAGGASFLVAAGGAIIPFLLGFYIFTTLGHDMASGLIVGAALAATSIAITVRILEEYQQTHTREAKIIINAAVIDDVLGLAILAVVISIIAREAAGGSPLGVLDILLILGQVFALWGVLLLGGALIIPRFIKRASLLKAEGSVEVAATASCFGSAAAASFFGLSPIVGAFAAGMAVAEPKLIARTKDFVNRINFIFSPIFFAVIGARVDFRLFTLSDLTPLLLLTVVAVLGKVLGCGLVSAPFLKSRRGWLRVGFGMTPRGELGLIIAGLGLATGILATNLYTILIGMVIITTIITPLILRFLFEKPNTEEIEKFD